MNLVKLSVLSFLIGILGISGLSAQSSSELESLNAYIDFLNESVDGLAIAHLLLTNNNKSINKYIDLEEVEVVYIPTSELPSNIFDKSDDSSDYYNNSISPIELSELCYEKSQSLDPNKAARFNKQTQEIVNILNRINTLRFSIEDFILENDLNEREAIYGVYEYLNFTSNSIYNSLKDVHTASKDILRDMRSENEKNSVSNYENLSGKAREYRLALSKTGVSNKHSKAIWSKVSETLALVKEYIDTPNVPKESEVYGKNYYYHNYKILTKFNQVGNGFVREMNLLLEGLDLPFVKLDEEPMIFKVIYPVKVEEAKELEKTKPKVKRAEATISTKMKLHDEPIKTDSRIVEIEVFDHNINDQDSISVMFNGQSVLDNHVISNVAKKFTVTVEEGKSNLLVFEAKNLGLIPPNTLAVSYRYQGKRKRILLENDLGESEAIEVILQKPE